MTGFDYVTEQYKEVQASRQVLFAYCETISPVDLVNENSSFGRGGSIRNLLIHMANVYEFWIGNNTLKKNITYTTYESKAKIAEIIAVFDAVNVLMAEFLAMFKQEEQKQITYELNKQAQSASILKIFTHVITHEFHHKGQILSLSRHLVYTPVDTDIIRLV